MDSYLIVRGVGITPTPQGKVKNKIVSISITDKIIFIERITPGRHLGGTKVLGIVREYRKWSPASLARLFEAVNTAIREGQFEIVP